MNDATSDQNESDHLIHIIDVDLVLCDVLFHSLREVSTPEEIKQLFHCSSLQRSEVLRQMKANGGELALTRITMEIVVNIGLRVDFMPDQNAGKRNQTEAHFKK